MPTITCHESRILCDDDSVLNSLENAGIAIPSGCRTGHCQSCVAQLVSGELSPKAQNGLTANQKRLNYFLTCQSVPHDDIEISLLGEDSRRTATLIEKHLLNDQVIRARFKADIDWKAGQFLTLWRSENQGRIYSIASRPEEGYIELHLRRRNGVISGWLEHELAINDQCEIDLPRGNCFYSPAMPQQNIVMVALGTGLAPIYGILKQALADSHHGNIWLYVVAGTPKQFYLVEELEQLTRECDKLHLNYIVRNNPNMDISAQEDNVLDVITRRHKILRNHLVYLCGPTKTVRNLQEVCFMQGAAHSDIFFDMFESG